MPLSIRVCLRSGRYDAGAERPSESEWPPHPARVFCALAASAEDDADWSALRWLEQQAPPQVWSDPVDRVRRGQARAYVVQNAIQNNGGNLNWPGRTNGLRARAFAVPSCECFAIVWPQAEPPAEILNRLSHMAWMVPYVGRSTSTAQVSAAATLPPDIPGGVIYESTEFTGGLSWDLRIPYSGYTDALRDAYLDGRRSWEVARVRPYHEERSTGGRAEAAATDMSDAVAGPFADLMVWSIERPVARIGGDQVVALTRSLRNAVMSRVPDPVPGQISGHTAPGRPHVAFLALPDVGHAHADGHILGIALAIPRDMPAEDLTCLLRAVILEPPLTEIRLASGRPLAVRYGADRVGMSPSRWAAADRRGGYEWVTVTPLMLDGHTRRSRDEASEVARSLVMAGYPEPAAVEVSGTPMMAGAVWRPRNRTLPEGRPRRQLVHVRVRFRESVTGPVLAGSMRYLGLGLFLPVSQERPMPPRRPTAGQGADPGPVEHAESPKLSGVS